MNSKEKKKFSDQIDSFELLESREQEIFNIFVSQHKMSKGEKGKFMTESVEAYFEDLLNLDGWKIYYLNTEKEWSHLRFVMKTTMVAIFITQVEIMNLIH